MILTPLDWVVIALYFTLSAAVVLVADQCVVRGRGMIAAFVLSLGLQFGVGLDPDSPRHLSKVTRAH